MPGPGWDDENNNMFPTCEDGGDALTPQQRSFLARIKNKDTLDADESLEIYEIWHEVMGLEPQ